MTTGSTGTKRRTLLQRGLALLAGGAAMAGSPRLVAAASPPAALPLTLTFYARSRPVAGVVTGAGSHHHPDGRIVGSGDLLDAADGNPVGTFYTNCFCLPSPFGAPVSTAANLEFHVLQLKDGTLFSIGAGANHGAERALAIVGGTGRYAGRSGSYVQRSIAGNYGEDMRQLMVTFAG
jgi:hypothetical protein